MKIDFGFHLPNFILLMHRIKVSCLIPTGNNFSLIKRGNLNFTLIGLTFVPGKKISGAKCQKHSIITRTAGSLVRSGMLT